MNLIGKVDEVEVVHIKRKTMRNEDI